MVADQHAPHRERPRPGHRDRQRAGVHPAPDRRDPAPAGAARGRARRRPDACVAARPRAEARRGRAWWRCSCSPPSPPRGCRSTRATPSGPRRSCASSAARACSAGRRWTRATAAGAGGWPGRRSSRWRCSPTRLRSTARPTGNSRNWRARTRIEQDLLALVASHAINLRCGPVGVPNHAPIPLLALYLKTSPANIVSAQVGHIARGVYVDPASREVEQDYVLDPRDPHQPVSVPARLHRVGVQQLVADLHPLLARRVRSENGPCTPCRSRRVPVPDAAHGSGPGTPAAPAGDRLRLLPSGPDLVRKPTPRGTRTIDAPSDGATEAAAPRRGIRPR